MTVRVFGAAEAEGNGSFSTITPSSFSLSIAPTRCQATLRPRVPINPSSCLVLILLCMYSMYIRSLVHPYVQSLLSCPIEALFDSASKFGNEGRRSKEEKDRGDVSIRQKDRTHVGYSLGQASSALRSKRLKDGQTALRRGTAKVFKGALEKDALKRVLYRKSPVARLYT